MIRPSDAIFCSDQTLSLLRANSEFTPTKRRVYSGQTQKALFVEVSAILAEIRNTTNYFYKTGGFSSSAGRWSDIFLYECHKSGAVFLAFIVADAGYETELLNGSGLLGSQRMKYLVAEDNIGWKILFLGADAA